MTFDQLARIREILAKCKPSKMAALPGHARLIAGSSSPAPALAGAPIVSQTQCGTPLVPSFYY